MIKELIKKILSVNNNKEDSNIIKTKSVKKAVEPIVKKKSAEQVEEKPKGKLTASPIIKPSPVKKPMIKPAITKPIVEKPATKGLLKQSSSEDAHKSKISGATKSKEEDFDNNKKYFLKK